MKILLRLEEIRLGTIAVRSCIVASNAHRDGLSKLAVLSLWLSNPESTT